MNGYKNLNGVLNEYAKYVIQQSKTNLTKDKKGNGDLYNSLSYDILVNNENFLVDFLMEDYGIFVDKGVKGKTSTYPETQAALSQFQYGSGTGLKGGLTRGIRQWLGKKKFQWKDKKTGRFMSYESMTYIIARSIYNKGLKANLFFTRPFEKGLEKLPQELYNAFVDDVDSTIIISPNK
tara:strand:- start:11853 stop:12389 length:537 start_codon:yes stop_codon:yes gene_type:complete